MSDPRDPNLPENVNRGHQGLDANVRAIAWATVLLLLGTVVVHVVVWFVYLGFGDHFLKTDPGVNPLAQERRPPPEPQLQQSPRVDMQRMRRANQQRLESYGWVDRDQRVIHIPIERAMQIYLVQHRGEKIGGAGAQEHDHEHDHGAHEGGEEERREDRHDGGEHDHGAHEEGAPEHGEHEHKSAPHDQGEGGAS